MQRLPEFRLEAYFSKWEFTARYNLAASDMQTYALTELIALASVEDRRRWETLELGYIESRGQMPLRNAIAATFEHVDAQDLICFAGAEEGLYCTMHALLDASDHAVVLTPNYQSMESVPRSICDVTGIALRAQTNWDLDLDEVRASIRPNTRLIAVNFPNNPTGKIIPQSDFRELIALCAQRGIYLFSDEVYRGIERDPGKRLPLAADLYERALSLGVVSKALGLPGLRVGWIACREPAVLDRLEQLKHYLSICNAAPSEVLACIALKAAPTILVRNRALTIQNLELLAAFFARHGDRLEWYEPDGGCISFPRYLGTDGVEAFCSALVNETGVLLLPASMYYSDLLPVPADRFRIGYGRRGMGEALSAFETFLSK